MWSCDYTPGKTVQLKIMLKNTDSSRPHCGISRIKIWNFNRSLTELSIGVRAAVVRLNNDIVYDGDIDKGCGNQVFDYGQVIDLQDKHALDTVPTKEKSEPQQDMNTSTRKKSSENSVFLLAPSLTPNIDNVSLHSDEEQVSPLRNLEKHTYPSPVSGLARDNGNYGHKSPRKTEETIDREKKQIQVTVEAPEKGKSLKELFLHFRQRNPLPPCPPPPP